MSLRQRPFSLQLIVLVSFFLLASVLGHAQCTGSGPYTCTETQSVVIPAGPNGTGLGTYVPATVYPSSLTISGLSGTIATISVQLHGLTSNATGSGCGTADFGVLLKAPNGSYMELMGLAGNCGANNLEDWSNGGVTLTIQDGATHMPYSGDSPCTNTTGAGWPNPIESGGANEGTFAPTSCPQGINYDTYPSPGPGTLNSATAAAPFGSATLTGTFATGSLSPNGAWSLYLVDDQGQFSINDDLSISGWSLILTLNAAATSTTTTLSSNINPSFTSGANSSVTLTATVTASSGTPTGTVAFKDGANTISGCGAQTLSGGQTTCVTTFATQGNHALTADYSGGGGFTGSDSSTLNQFVETPTTGSFCNDGGITMPGLGNTSPYPSVINVTGISNGVATVSLTLNGFSWNESADAVHLLLVSPNNQALEFFSASTDATSGNYTFIDSGAQAPQETAISPGTYQPTVYTIGDVFTPQPPLPAPQVPASFAVAEPAGGASAGTFESTFNGAVSNGAWALFVYDDAGSGASGSITGGWCLNITQATGAATTTTLSATPNPALTGAAVTVTATVKSGGNPVNGVGVVTFTENGQNVAGGPTSPVAVDSNGHASFTTSSLPEGDHDILGTYTDSTQTYALSFGSRYVRVNNPSTESVNGLVYTYCNPGTITIPGPLNPTDEGPASPNPSNIFVANAPGTINHFTVKLNGVQLSTPYFLTSLLVGPLDTAANSLDFFSDVGGSNPTGPVNITLDDSAASGLSTGNAGSPLVSGTFKPTSGKGNDTFSPSASGFYTPPSGPYLYAAPVGTTTFGQLYDNENPNGTWSLYLYQDNQSTNSSMNSWCVNLTENPPILAITKSHSGDFTQGEIGAQYTVVVSNNGPGSTGGTVTVTENPPTGLTVTGMTGNNWNCTTTSCTRSDALAQGGTYDDITVTVNVADNAPGTVTNIVGVSGGGTVAAQSAEDPTTVLPAPVLFVSKTHVGTAFTGGLTGEWDIVVSNTASGSTTSGTLTVSDPLPSGFTLNSYTGTGWSCTGSTTVTCTSTQVVAGGSSFFTIALTVNVPSVNSQTMITNTATASGAGSFVSASGSDTVQVNPGTYQLTTSASPSAGGTVSPVSGPQTAGSVVSLVATPNSGYAFQNWTSSPDAVANPTSASTTITMNSAETVTANFVVNTVNVTVGTSPTGLAFSVDGTNYTSTQSFTWTIGSGHTIATTTPQTPGAGTQYNFTSWSDGGAISHPVTAASGTTSYTASFSTSYQLITAANPTNGGTVTPASGSYYPSGTVVPLTATPNPNYAFVNWTGNVANQNSASTTVTMNAPQSVTANFSLNTVNVTVGTNPAGLAFSVDGTNYTSTQSFTWTIGSGHTIATTTPQTPVAGTQYNFTSWSDGGSLSHSVTAASGTTSYTASFSTSYQLITAANPTNGGTVTPTSGSYYPSGTVVPLTATPNSNYAFVNWTGNVANPNSPSTTVTMNAPQSVTANFVSSGGVTVTPTSIAFGNVIVGRGAKQVVTVQNNSGHTVQMGPITLTVTMGDASQFKLDHVCPANLKSGKHCLIGVDFRPDAVGSDTATLNIVTSAPGSPIEVPITGAGVPKPKK